LPQFKNPAKNSQINAFACPKREIIYFTCPHILALGGFLSMSSERIRELNYQIKRVELDIKNLERTIEVKRRNKLLDPEIENELRGKISEKRSDISGLQAEIRRIENEAIRAQNMA